MTHVYEDYADHDRSALWGNMKRKSGLVLVRALIWGIAGGFFGVVFLGVLRHLHHWSQGAGMWEVVTAAAVGGSIIGAFYSAKRVAIIGAAAGSVASTAYLIAASTPTSPWPVLGVCAAAGFVVGALASAMYERRRGALLVALAGLGAGAFAGAVAWLVGSLVGGEDRLFLLTVVLAPVTGVLFTLATFTLAPRVNVPLPQWLSIGLVTAGVSAVVGAGLWVLAVPLAHDIEPALQSAVGAMLADLPRAFLGGLAGGALAGVVLELLNVPWVYNKMGHQGEEAPST